MTNYLWRDAEVTYPDWSGNAQLDQRMTGSNASFERLVGLDPDEWIILGFDIGWGEIEQDVHELHVVAARRADIRGSDSAEGELPVTDFLIHDADPIEVLRAISHVFELRLRRRGIGDRPLRVVALADIPEQA
jgi:PAS domain-containing protein